MSNTNTLRIFTFWGIVDAFDVCYGIRCYVLTQHSEEMQEIGVRKFWVLHPKIYTLVCIAVRWRDSPYDIRQDDERYLGILPSPRCKRNID